MFFQEWESRRNQLNAIGNIFARSGIDSDFEAAPYHFCMEGCNGSIEVSERFFFAASDCSAHVERLHRYKGKWTPLLANLLEGVRSAGAVKRC
jgi:hypothetical protein